MTKRGEVENDGPCWSCEDGEGCPTGCVCDCPLCLQRYAQEIMDRYGQTVEEFCLENGLM